jgi:hypothetical protein
MIKPKNTLNREGAETLALTALGFLAEDASRLGRFLALTGIGPSELRSQAEAPQTLSAVLEHLLQDESLLLVFSASTGVKPESVAEAHGVLSRTSRKERP